MKRIMFAVLIVIVAVLGFSGCCSYDVAVSAPAYPYRTYYYSVYPPRPYYYSPYYGYYYYRPAPPPPRRHRHHRY